MKPILIALIAAGLCFINLARMKFRGPTCRQWAPYHNMRMSPSGDTVCAPDSVTAAAFRYKLRAGSGAGHNHFTY